MQTEIAEFSGRFWVASPAENDILRPVISRVIAAILAVLAVVLSGCVKDSEHQVVISTVDQQMALLKKGVPLGTYAVSTSKFGLGDVPNSFRTPVGRLEVEKKIGDNAPMGAVFKNRERT